MADEQPGVDPRLAVAARHALHDEELVASYAAGAAGEDESGRARALIERCTTCSSLAQDIEAITSAIRSLDDAASAASHLPAPRDFRITPEQAGQLRPAGLPARQLRPAGLLARVTRGLRGAAIAYGRPLGASLATFGLVGLLVGTVSLSPAGAPATVLITGPEATAAEAPGLPAENQPGGTATTDRNGPRPAASDAGAHVTGTPRTARDDALEGGGLWVLLAGSIVLLVLGVAFLYAGLRGRARAPSRGPGGDRS